MDLLFQTEATETPQANGAPEAVPDGRMEKAAARGTVLVVEDDPTHREFLVELLQLWGYQSVPVGTAEEAEYVLRRRHLDAAIVDVFLPGRSGATLFTRIRERFPDAVLIGASAMSDAVMARRCKGLGADLFLGKPIAPERLAEALQSRPQSWH